jgi:hypothetical protein
MRRSVLLVVLAALATWLLSAAPAQAEHRHRRGRVVIDTPRVIVVSPGTTLAHRPPGWDRGRKVGWGNCDLPPGLAKKYGCSSTFFGRQRIFDRRFDPRFRRGSGVVIRIPGLLHLDLR